MCGILLTNKIINDLEKVIFYLKKRGPDLTNVISQSGWTFVHTLLSMTGDLTAQPFVNGQIIAMFNGEIYNYKDFSKDYKTDGECIIPCYLQYGNDFIKKLDGEFAIILLDFNKKEIIASTDIFSTKPLWLGLDDQNIGLSSYKSCLDQLSFNNIVQVKANSTYIIDIETLKVKSINTLWNFDLTQSKSTFDDWNTAFEKSILKRTRDAKHGIFIGLSSGYDSGAISCALNKLGVDYFAYSIVGSEDESIIKRRQKLIKNMEIINLDKLDFMKARQYLKDNCEEYQFNIDNGETEVYENKLNKALASNDQNVISKTVDNLKSVRQAMDFRKSKQILTDDNGSVGVSHICTIARNKKQLIYLSGSGADEIFSDYGFMGVKHFGHSTIGGYFPKDLSTVFPWKDFFGNTQRAYLRKEEHVTGSYGIEGRYPFLDRDVVQEFLWLKPELKNQHYKAPLNRYLNLHKYPFKVNGKVGFNCGFTGPSHSSQTGYTERKSTFTVVGKTTDPELIIDKNNINTKSCEEIEYLSNDKIKHHGGFCYYYEVSTNHLGDVSGLPSPYVLNENGKFLQSGHSDLQSIIDQGMGKYLHITSNKLYFSTSDNSDPRTNNRVYKVESKI